MTLINISRYQLIQFYEIISKDFVKL